MQSHSSTIKINNPLFVDKKINYSDSGVGIYIYIMGLQNLSGTPFFQNGGVPDCSFQNASEIPGLGVTVLQKSTLDGRYPDAGLKNVAF